jgi:glycosyltransferase involved in cell wall biosynthesis
LQQKYDYQFTILVSEDDTFESRELEVQTISSNAWKSLSSSFPLFPRQWTYRRCLDPIFSQSDLVLTVDPTAFPQGALGIRRANKVGTPIWFDSSATLNGDFELLQVLRKPVERRLLRQTDRILTTVPKTIERFRDRRLYDETIANKFEILGHSVDTNKFSPSDTSVEGATTILTVSRLVPEKGLLYILDAIAPLLQENEDVEFHILGAGPMRSQLERRVKQLEIDESVSFLGTVPHEKVPDIIKMSDIFVNHAVSNSHWEEFFGVANLEAMACGVPVVVSDSGGIPYVLRRDGTAKIVSQRNISELRTALRELIDNPDLRKKIGMKAREYVVETYSVEQIGERYHKLVVDEL